MAINTILDNTKMYRLPYSKNDNPNGWIEVTTHCNMKCYGCYKGIDRDGAEVKHEPLENIKSDILDLKRIRNCGIITISGGEALMHPQIEEIVRFTHSLGLKSFIHTNGILVNKENALKMRKSGLTGFIVRIDTENRPEYASEILLHPLRDDIAEIIETVGGLQLGFTMVITPKNIDQVPHVVQWFQANNKRTDYLVLILKREFRFSKNQIVNADSEISIDVLATTLHNSFPNMIFSSYLGNQEKNIGFKWLQTAWISCNGKVLGYIDSRTVEFATVMGHLKKGNYSYVTNNERNYISLAQMITGGLILKSMRMVLWRYISNPLNVFRKANNQVINIVNPPGNSPENRGFCDACPDAVLHDGVIQPSCVLEGLIQMEREKYG